MKISTLFQAYNFFANALSSRRAKEFLTLKEFQDSQLWRSQVALTQTIIFVSKNEMEVARENKKIRKFNFNGSENNGAGEKKALLLEIPL